MKYRPTHCHMTMFIKKLLKFTGMFYKLREMLPYHCLHKLYFAFVHSQLPYGLVVCGSCSIYALDGFHKLNNNILHILLNKNWISQ